MTQVAPCRSLLYQNSWSLWELDFLPAKPSARDPFAHRSVKPGIRDSRKAVPIVPTPRRLTAAEVPFEQAPSNSNATITQLS